MFSLKKNEGFENILRMIREQNKEKVNHSSEIEKSLNSLKYDKQAFGLTQEDYKTVGLLRSVVVDEEGNIVAYSPPKCLPITEEREKMFNDSNIMTQAGDASDAAATTETNQWCAEEFVEGTMINLFYSKTQAGEGWEIATKSTVGGNVVFYSSKNPKDTVEIRDKDTFRNMFFETCTNIGFKYEDLPKDLMYSFVLQHPKNRIVLLNKEAKIYIIGIYSINKDTLDVTQLSTAGFEETYGSGVVMRPKQLFADSYNVEGFKKEYASMNSSYNMMGVVFSNMVTGERMKVRNPMYEMVKNMKGAEQKLQLQYLTLRHGGRVADYLKAFPEYKADFAVFRSQLHGFTRSLHQNYLDCFVLKKRPFGEFPQQYKKFMSGLHKKYLEELRENKGSVTFNYVVEFVNTQNPMFLMYSLNYVVREHKNKSDRVENNMEESIIVMNDT